MLAEFLYEWNPFNIYGTKVEYEDLIHRPLLSCETLMQDRLGHCRRLKVPADQANLLEKIMYWFQVHLNEKGHLEAIDKLISLFYQELLLNPPEKTEELQKLNSQINQLRQLKNDYFFVYLKKGDPTFIDLRLSEIEQHAYSIFSYYYKQLVDAQEEERKLVFQLFEKKAEKSLKYLREEYKAGLTKARLLMIMPENILFSLVEERIHSLDQRLLFIQNFYTQMSELEKHFEGTFTIPNLSDWINHLRSQLQIEKNKIAAELEIVIKSLILHSHLVPCDERVKQFLKLMEVDPDIWNKRSSSLFKEVLEDEINRMKSLFEKKHRSTFEG